MEISGNRSTGAKTRDEDELSDTVEPNINSESSEPIQILVFPPKNKRFRVDEKTNSLQLEPVDNTLTQNEDELPCKFGDEGNTEEENPVFDKSVVTEVEKNRNLDETSSNSANRFTNNNIHVTEILKVEKPFTERNCFLKGCKWSPDGFCLLSNSEDNVLRLFEIPECSINLNTKDVLPVLVAKEGGTVYDFVWYPKMCSSDPLTCVFASTSQNSPIHLWDAYTGILRATYQPINQYDEVTTAYSLAFSPDGSKIYSGFKKLIKIFDVSQPGRKSQERNLKTKGSSVFQTNIISCICVNPVMPNIYVVGSYDKTIGIYTEPEGELQCLLKGHQGGLTQIMFSKNGIQLFSGGRKDSEIICWDLRNPGKILFILNRKVNTNQRIYFDLNDQGYLVTGSTDGNIIMYDTWKTEITNGTCLEPKIKWKGHDDCVNGVNFHPVHSVLASSSGQYHLPSTNAEDDNGVDEISNIDNSLKLWLVDLIT